MNFRSDATQDLGTCFEPTVHALQTPLVNAFGAQFLLEPAPYLASSFSPTWTSLLSTSLVACVSTGLADQGVHALEVYPVPAHDERLYERNAPLAGLRYRITDVQGRAVLGGVCQSAEAGIDVAAPTSGAYTSAIGSGAAEQRIRFMR